MKQRCLNTNHKHYSYYGGRGINVYEEWLKPKPYIDYVLTHLGERPSKNHTLDRVDNNKGYEPGNLRWATRKQQSGNTRVRSDSRTGHKGVSWDETRGKWVVRMTIDSKYRYVGRYDCLSDAIAASTSINTL